MIPGQARVLLTCAVTLLGADAWAQPASPAAAVDARRAAYRAMAASFKQVTDQVRGGNPDIAAIRAGTMALARFTVNQAKLFPPGSGVASGAKTQAKDLVWTDRAGFARAQANFSTSVAALLRAAKAGNMAEIKAAHGQVGQQCLACHNVYRN